MRPETLEDYLKTIYHLSTGKSAVVTNQQLARKLGIRPASVTEALRKLHELRYVVYEKSYGSRLTAAGSKLALNIVRRHRVWETYLVKVLGFGWEEVHEIAEELEHIRNDKLISKLAEILGHPGYDPHGDPIPDEKGKFRKNKFIKLADAVPGSKYRIMGVSDHSPLFLKYLEKHGLIVGAEFLVKNREAFDGSLQLLLKKQEITLSTVAAANMVVELFS